MTKEELAERYASMNGAMEGSYVYQDSYEHFIAGFEACEKAEGEKLEKLEIEYEEYIKDAHIVITNGDFKERLKAAWEDGNSSRQGFIHENFGSPYVEYENDHSFEDYYKSK